MKQIYMFSVAFVLFFSAAFVAQAAIILPPAGDLPTTVDECKQEGWEAYLVFKNQGDCVSFIATDGTNPPALE